MIRLAFVNEDFLHEGK